MCSKWSNRHPQVLSARKLVCRGIFCFIFKRTWSSYTFEVIHALRPKKTSSDVGSVWHLWRPNSKSDSRTFHWHSRALLSRIPHYIKLKPSLLSVAFYFFILLLLGRKWDISVALICISFLEVHGLMRLLARREMMMMMMMMMMMTLKYNNYDVLTGSQQRGTKICIIKLVFLKTKKILILKWWCLPKG